MQSLSTKVSRFSILFVTIALFGVYLPLRAQVPAPKVPIPVEFMAGNNRMFFQMVVKRKFTPESKFGFLSVASLNLSYDNEMVDNEMAGPLLVTYNIYKGFGLVGGATINNKIGYAPLLGTQHTFANREWLSVTVASLFLNSTKSIELLGIYEFKPTISPKLNMYNRLQFLYVHNTQENFHARSFLLLRTGLKVKALNFGLGANLDQYGPMKIFKPNYGLFLGWDFF
jgi:hypothetical protein